jgi:hypothetical protein
MEFAPSNAGSMWNVCEKIPTRDSFKLRLGNHYLSPDFKTEILENILTF